MGFDIAQSAANLGASVILVAGPTHFKIDNQLVKVIPVVSAQEMFDVCHSYFSDVDVAIARQQQFADYRPKNVSLQKIKKEANEFSIELEKTKDILASLGKIQEKSVLNWFCFGNRK